jgi:ubiquinone/menaquinone biosynthesis C-methylase UbiE
LGCGTGFFTPTIAERIDEQGTLIAMGVLPQSVDIVTEKVQTANLKNVRVVQGDALNTNLDDQSVDAVLLLGVILAPMLPSDRSPEWNRSPFPAHGTVC